MLKKPMLLVFKTLEFLLTLACCLLLVWRCYQNENHSQIPLLVGFYGVTSFISLGSLIVFCIIKEPIMKYEAQHSFIMGVLHLTAIYIHLNVAIVQMCTVSVLVALSVTALYLLHCNMALDDMFSDGSYPEPPLIMPPFYFKRTGGPQVYLCEPLPSLHGPSGLPPIYYKEI